MAERSKKEFSLKIDERGLVQIFFIAGDFASINVVEVREAFLAAEKKQCKKLGVVLQEIDTIDSMGIGLLVNIKKKLTAEGGSLLLINPNKRVQDVIEITGTSFDIRSNIKNFHDITSIFSEDDVQPSKYKKFF